MTDYTMRNGMVSKSRAELIKHYALDAYESLKIPTVEGWRELSDEQAGIVYDAIAFGVQVACTVLEETSTFEDEYQAMLKKLREAHDRAE